MILVHSKCTITFSAKRSIDFTHFSIAILDIAVTFYAIATVVAINLFASFFEMVFYFFFASIFTLFLLLIMGSFLHRYSNYCITTGKDVALFKNAKGKGIHIDIPSKSEEEQ